MSKTLVAILLASSIIGIPNVLTKLIRCSNEEVLDHSLLDEVDTPMAADGQNDDIALEDYLDDASEAFEAPWLQPMARLNVDAEMETSEPGVLLPPDCYRSHLD